MSKGSKTICIFLMACVAVGMLGGCREHSPHSFALGPGTVTRSHGEPIEGAYYSNWDPYAVELEVMPVEDTNPVQTQHVIIATVKDANGKPLPNRRVEWMIPEDSVGTFVEVDESGWRDTRGHKVTNQFAVTHTNNFDHVMTRGTDDPSDDIHLKAGQTWVVITSAVEGTTHVIAYAPGIYNWNKHKVFVKKNWYDVAWRIPPEATNRIGSDHQMVTKVMKHSDKTPLAGYQVQYKIVSGPEAYFEPGGANVATVTTSENGLAAVTLKQRQPTAGVNDVEVTLVRPENTQCCIPAVIIGTEKTKKTWLAPSISISKTAPAVAVAGDDFQYSITVTNPSQVAANNVTVTDTLPAGIDYVSASPTAQVSGKQLTWSMGSMKAGGSATISVTVKGSQTGTFTNCAVVSAADGLTDKACADTKITQAKLAMTILAPSEIVICDELPYTIEVRNTGDAAATNVQVKANLPQGVETMQGQGSMTFDVGTLQPGESKTMQMQTKALRKGQFTNAGQATADGNLAAQASASTTVLSPNLVVSKQGPAQRYIGREFTYTIEVRNTGDAVAQNTMLVEKISANAQLIKASEGAQIEGNKITWNLGTIDPNESNRVTVTMKSSERGEISALASATAYCAEASAESATEVKGVPALLLECVDMEDPIMVGSRETYLVTVTNQGSAVGTNIVIKCMLPVQHQYLDAEGPTDAMVDGQTITFKPLGALAPKAKATYRIETKGTGTGDVRFRVMMTSDQLSTPVEESESTNIYSD